MTFIFHFCKFAALYTILKQQLLNSMKKAFFIFIIILSSNASGQTLKDSINIIYKNYFNLLNTKEKLDTIVLKVENFEELMESNNRKIKSLTDAELFSLKKQLQQRRKKIVNTTDFVFAANASLNAIKQLDATSDYLTKISSLNNPENAELGFSLSNQIAIIIEKNIFKGKSKINGIKKSKFLLFVDNIIKSPITKTISSAMPIVNSIKSIVDLVIGNAIKDKNVSINHIVELKKSLKVYLEHYEGLAKCQVNFEQNLRTLDIRKKGLVLLLTQYTTERSNTLNPNMISEKDKKTSLTQLINRYYTNTIVQQKVAQIINLKPFSYSAHLTDNKLIYPNYALNQAKFIRDEIESLSKEYASTFTIYQLELKKVLQKSKNIGDATKIDAKIIDLESKLLEVKNAFDDNLNIYKLNYTFKTLIRY